MPGGRFLQIDSSVGTTCGIDRGHQLWCWGGYARQPLELAACAEADLDCDGTLDETDAAPSDPCVPSEDAIACKGSDSDGDGIANAVDSAPTDPCMPFDRVLACAQGDLDRDGTPNADDVAPSDPCVPSVAAAACNEGSRQGGAPSAGGAGGATTGEGGAGGHAGVPGDVEPAALRARGGGCDFSRREPARPRSDALLALIGAAIGLWRRRALAARMT